MTTPLDQMMMSLAASRLNFKLAYKPQLSNHLQPLGSDQAYRSVDNGYYVLSVWDKNQSIRRRPKLEMSYTKDGNAT